MIKYDKIIITPKDIIKIQQIAIRYNGNRNLIMSSDEYTTLMYSVIKQSNVTYKEQLITQELVENNEELAFKFADLIVIIATEFAKLLDNKKKDI